MSDEATGTPAPPEVTGTPTEAPSETPAQPQTQPPPAAAQEAPVEPPPWVTARLDSAPMGEPRPGYLPPPPPQYYGPQYDAPAPSYYPTPPPMPQWNPQWGPQPNAPQPPRVSIDDLARDPDAAINSKVMATLGPLLNRVQQQEARLKALDEFGQRQHETAIVRSFEQAQATVRDVAYGTVFPKDPAFKNRAVQERVHYAVTRFMREQFEIAARTGDTRGLEWARTEKPYKLILAAAKEDAGWSDNTQRLEVQGAFVETSRSGPASPAANLDDETRAGLRRLGITEEDYIKAETAHNERVSKHGWGV